MKIKLGIAPINWCNDDDPNLGKDISFEQCIQEMAQAGYVGTELGNKFPRDESVLKEALNHRGLQLSSAWFSTYFTEPERYDTTLSQFLDHLSFMRALGARYINVCECGHSLQDKNTPIISPEKPEFTAEQWTKLIQGLHAIGRVAYDFNIRVVYHYHAGTGIFTDNEIDQLMNNTNPELVSLLLDTGHAAFAGINPLNLIKEYGERIHYVHLKDVRSDVLQMVENEQLNFMDAVRAGVFTVPGDGSIDFPSVINALKKYNYEGWMIVEAEQDPDKANPYEYAKKAYEYLRPLVY
ncbi:MAG: myo-inosose-2 dehydratase [Legionella sp.]|nr:MAG: myo-inosose-2 dehydratase [Legionella sp.]